jgi:hypothetical protein
MASLKVRHLATGLLATALAAAPPLLGEPIGVRVLTPLPGTHLVAGSEAELAWEPRPNSALPPGDEWEAFVSLDGGRTYSVRITPHLDRAVRRITWTVPEVASTAVRLILRFGDEERETAFESPELFTIEPGRIGDLFLERAARSGESARPGDAGVTVWEEGSRHGGARRRVMSLITSVRSEWGGEGRTLPVVFACAPRSDPFLSLPSAGPALIFDGAARATASLPEQPLTINRLLQTSRRNE